MSDDLAKVMEKEVTDLLENLKPEICDDYRATDDPEDTEPGMQITIASNDGKDWVYQTGDNSYSGSCYHKRHWGVGYLYRDSDCKGVAAEMVDQVFDGIASEVV